MKNHVLKLGTLLSTIAILIVLIDGYPLRAAEPVLSQSDEEFLRTQAQRIVQSASLPAGQLSGKWQNATPYDVHVPGGNMGYPAYWVRDSVMMLGGNLISARELEGWIRLTAGVLKGPGDWQVRPGVVVPAYAVPDHINFDGKPTFYPGNYESGDKQGGYPFGKYPPLDDNFYFITAVYDQWKLTGNLALFNAKVKTSFNEMRLADLCDKVYEQPPSDRATGLLIAGDVKTENAKDWGFCDGIFKSGKLLFPSVLKYVAALQLAQLSEAAGEPVRAKRYREDAARIKQAIPPTFFRASQNGNEGWLYSATGVGHQPDVWGSAFAIYAGAVDSVTAPKVARSLVRAYREKTAVRDGCARQILTTDTVNKGGWENTGEERGAYQNGGYWGTGTGWYICAIATVDAKAAADMARDFVQFLRTNMRPDGMAQTWEWFNPDTGRHNNPLYVASVALPYLCLKQAGLLKIH